MNLDDGRIGKRCRIEAMALPVHIERRLEALGMTAGSVVEILNSKSGGTVVIKVRGTRFALGRGIAGKIAVTEVE